MQDEKIKLFYEAFLVFFSSLTIVTPLTSVTLGLRSKLCLGRNLHDHVTSPCWYNCSQILFFRKNIKTFFIVIGFFIVVANSQFMIFLSTIVYLQKNMTPVKIFRITAKLRVTLLEAETKNSNGILFSDFLFDVDLLSTAIRLTLTFLDQSKFIKMLKNFLLKQTFLKKPRMQFWAVLSEKYSSTTGNYMLKVQKRL